MSLYHIRDLLPQQQKHCLRGKDKGMYTCIIKKMARIWLKSPFSGGSGEPRQCTFGYHKPECIHADAFEGRYTKENTSDIHAYVSPKNCYHFCYYFKWISISFIQWSSLISWAILFATFRKPISLLPLSL
jgi:hypothetical protein